MHAACVVLRTTSPLQTHHNNYIATSHRDVLSTGLLTNGCCLTVLELTSYSLYIISAALRSVSRQGSRSDKHSGDVHCANNCQDSRPARVMRWRPLWVRWPVTWLGPFVHLHADSTGRSGFIHVTCCRHRAIIIFFQQTCKINEVEAAVGALASDMADAVHDHR